MGTGDEAETAGSEQLSIRGLVWHSAPCFREPPLQAPLVCRLGVGGGCGGGERCTEPLIAMQAPSHLPLSVLHLNLCQLRLLLLSSEKRGRSNPFYHFCPSSGPRNVSPSKAGILSNVTVTSQDCNWSMVPSALCALLCQVSITVRYWITPQHVSPSQLNAATLGCLRILR